MEVLQAGTAPRMTVRFALLGSVGVFERIRGLSE